MSDCFAILPLNPPLDSSGLWKLSRRACAQLYRVQWLRAFLAADGSRVLCWYRAPDAEAVRLVLRQQGSEGVRVWPVGGDAPAPEGLSGLGRTRVVVELEPGLAPGPSRRARASEVASGALLAAGYSVALALEAEQGRCAVLVVDGQDGAAIRSCLEGVGSQVTGVWHSVELDPEPPALFRAVEPAVAGAKAPPGAGSMPPAPALRQSEAVVEAREPLDAVVIGAGLSGLCALHRLLAMGLSVRVYEAGSDVGGVWYHNRYPGARVDSEAYTYVFSFSDEVLREWQWTELFPAQPEVQRYLRFVADRLDLRRHVRVSTRVERAHYDAARGLWRVETDRGESVDAIYLVAATGVLSVPQLPDVAGLERFAGESHHTARWPAAGVPLEGRRVGVVGTGSSGVQVIQTIAPEVKRLVVFQRTPTYCIPQRNRPLSDVDREAIRRDWASTLASCRQSYGGFMYDFDPQAGLGLTPDEREQKFEALWERPGFAFWFANFADLMMNAEVNAHASEFASRKIRERVRDPDVARKLLPNHPFGCKRVPLEKGYYEVFNLDHVELVDLRDTPIVRVTKTGVETTRGLYPLDVIVYATGFDACTGALTHIDVRGEGGCSLADKWRDGPKTYLGLLVSGFPNLFIVNGPQNAAALCNAGRCIEHNVDWIARCIEFMRSRGASRIAPTTAAEQEWADHVEEVANVSVLREMKESWFFGANTPGKARRASIYAAGARQYREHCERAARSGYPGCRVS